MNKLRNLPKEHISTSQLNTYMSCPESYKRRYICRELPSNYIDVKGRFIGSAFDRFVSMRLTSIETNNPEYANDFYYIELVERIKGDEFIIIGNKKNFLRKFDELRYTNDPISEVNINKELSKILTKNDFDVLIDGYYEELKTGSVKRPSYLEIYQNLINYYLENEAEILKDIQVEKTQRQISYTFTRYRKDFTIKAYLDLFGHNKKTYHPLILDWKVAKSSWGVSGAQRLQDDMYAYVVMKETGIIPEFRYVVFTFSPKTGNIKHQIFSIRHTMESLDRVEASIHDVVRGINEKVFYKNESSMFCSEKCCEYYKACQGYKNSITVEILKTA